MILSREFKGYLKRGYRFVVLDGHNRICFLTDLITDQYNSLVDRILMFVMIVSRLSRSAVTLISQT